MAILYPPVEIIRKRKPEATPGERTLLAFLLNAYDDEYEIFFQPFLNGDLPDIIVMHKGGGVMIFEVKDWDLSNYHVNEKGNWIVNCNNSVYKNSPLNQVLKYKKNLYDLHIDSLLSLHLKDYKYWYVVKCAVYFHCHTTEYAQKFCEGEKPSDKYKTFLSKNFTIIGHDSLGKESMDRIFEKQWISKKNSYFTEELYNSFARILRPSYHTIEEGLGYKLSKEQDLLAKSEEGARKRIKGVAGSGKTLVLAERAVNAHKRTHNCVLILTYNITLRNYIHDKISTVRQEFAWEFFHISNYHDFINNNMNNVGLEFEFLKVEEGNSTYMSSEEFGKLAEKHVYSNIHLFENHKDELPKYEVILIDETQDYQENWIRIIMKYFASENAEIVAFADEKQNIYSRELDNEKMPRIPVQTGAWDRKLNKSYRLSQKIALLVTDFQKRFFADKYVVEQQIETNTMMSLFDEPYIEYHYYPLEESVKEDNAIATYIYQQIKEHRFHSNDVTILSSRIRMLRKLDYMLRTESKEKTNIMFETREEFMKLCPNAQTGFENNADILKIRKNRKANFWMNRGTIKLSTIHSFKGWESPVLFLVIEDNLKATKKLANTRPYEFSDELVYTGITRCQNYLFIINTGNQQYHEYFANCNLIDKKIGANRNGK